VKLPVLPENVTGFGHEPPLPEGAACVTAMVRVMPPPLIVTTPVRAAAPVLAVALTVKARLSTRRSCSAAGWIPRARAPGAPALL
jgi:hypothetical protein